MIARQEPFLPEVNVNDHSSFHFDYPMWRAGILSNVLLQLSPAAFAQAALANSPHRSLGSQKASSPELRIRLDVIAKDLDQSWQRRVETLYSKCNATLL